MPGAFLLVEVFSTMDQYVGLYISECGHSARGEHCPSAVQGGAETRRMRPASETSRDFYCVGVRMREAPVT